MPVTRARAQQLLTKAEFDFAAQSWSPAVNAHSPARLRQKISRARRLRDKYRDEARRQAGEAKGRRDPRGTRPARGNRNTELKAAIFDESLVRFEARLAKVEEAAVLESGGGEAKAAPARVKAAGKAKATRTAKAASTKAKAAGKAKAASVKTTGRKAPAAAKATAGKASTQASKGARKSGKITQSGAKKTQTHARARTGRSQARKDGR